MSDLHKETWENYVSSWGATSVEEKRALFAKSLAPECEYNDPKSKAKGYDELLACMLAFHKQMPGGHFVTKHFRAHHNQCIACWDMMAGDGTVAGAGISYGKYNAEGKLVVMTGFFDPRL